MRSFRVNFLGSPYCAEVNKARGAVLKASINMIDRVAPETHLIGALGASKE
jgi:hypothetical protein